MGAYLLNTSFILCVHAIVLLLDFAANNETFSTCTKYLPAGLAIYFVVVIVHTQLLFNNYSRLKRESGFQE